LSRKGALPLWERYKNRYEPYLRGIFTMWLRGHTLSDKQQGIADSILAELEGYAQDESDRLREALADQENVARRDRDREAEQARREREDAEFDAKRQVVADALAEGRTPEGHVLIDAPDWPGGTRWAPPHDPAAERQRAEADDPYLGEVWETIQLRRALRARWSKQSKPKPE
jgi:hypothetical protein